MASGCCNDKGSCGCNEPELVNMEGVSLADAVANVDPESALGRSLQRLVRNLNDPDGVISAFSSFVE